MYSCCKHCLSHSQCSQRRTLSMDIITSPINPPPICRGKKQINIPISLFLMTSLEFVYKIFGIFGKPSFSWEPEPGPRIIGDAGIIRISKNFTIDCGLNSNWIVPRTFLCLFRRVKSSHGNTFVPIKHFYHLMIALKKRENKNLDFLLCQTSQIISKHCVTMIKDKTHFFIKFCWSRK